MVTVMLAVRQGSRHPSIPVHSALWCWHWDPANYTPPVPATMLLEGPRQALGVNWRAEERASAPFPGALPAAVRSQFPDASNTPTGRKQHPLLIVRPAQRAQIWLCSDSCEFLSSKSQKVKAPPWPSGTQLTTAPTLSPSSVLCHRSGDCCFIYWVNSMLSFAFSVHQYLFIQL